MPAVTIYFLIHVKTAMERFGQLGQIYASDERKNVVMARTFSAWLHWLQNASDLLSKLDILSSFFDDIRPQTLGHCIVTTNMFHDLNFKV